jgi:hypothetical protein
MSASRLKWTLLTKKPGSSTQGIPPGKEHLAWVTNTATLVHGERDGRPGRYVPAAQVAVIRNQITPRASQETRGCPVERKLWLCDEVTELREIL